MNTLENRIRAAITSLGVPWGNAAELQIRDIKLLSVQGDLVFAELSMHQWRIPCLVMDHGTFADIFLSPHTLMNMFVEPRLRQHDIDKPFLLGA